MGAYFGHVATNVPTGAPRFLRFPVPLRGRRLAPDEARIRKSLRKLEPLAGMVHLDLGCGAGWATRMAAREGKAARAVGLDFSITGLKLARQHSPDILWLQADGTALPLADARLRPPVLQRRAGTFPRCEKGHPRDRPRPQSRRVARSSSCRIFMSKPSSRWSSPRATGTGRSNSSRPG